MALSKRTVLLFNALNKALFRVDGNLSYLRAVEAMRRLANSVEDDETDESDWYLGESGETTLDSLLVGSYWFFVHYHGGQDSPEYAAQCAICSIFSPGMSSGPEDESSEKDVYNAWIELSPYNYEKEDDDV